MSRVEAFRKTQPPTSGKCYQDRVLFIIVEPFKPPTLEVDCLPSVSCVYSDAGI
jgi:hypothetical protein